MITRTFEELVRDLAQRREVGDPPPALLLGAGASVASGVGAMTDLFRFIGCADFAGFCAYVAPLTTPERFRLLARFLQARRPDAITPGYRALAALCADSYFDVVLTTNLDPLLDDALADARLWRKDYLLLVNGVVRPDRLELLATAPSPRVKVLKLHGDLFQRFMAWTPEEMESYVTDASPSLRRALAGKDILVVGHSLRDARIRELVVSSGGTVWYTHPESVPDFLQKEDRVRAVVGPRCAFEPLFEGLASALHVRVAPARPEAEPAPAAAPPPARLDRGLLGRGPSGTPATAAAAAPGPQPPGRGAERVARTMDDLLASVVGVGAVDGPALMTGFLLAEPRVVITDGLAGNAAAVGPRPTLRTSDGRRLAAQVLRRVPLEPFGPLVLAAPDDLRVPGLAVDQARLAVGDAIRIAVAAGERVGVSSGVITATDVGQDVVPIGLVRHLVAAGCAVAPGASGAPVVDGELSVRGFVVAGGVGMPPTLVSPSAAWAGRL